MLYLKLRFLTNSKVSETVTIHQRIRYGLKIYWIYLVIIIFIVLLHTTIPAALGSKTMTEQSSSLESI